MKKIKNNIALSCVLLASITTIENLKAAEPINLITNPGFESSLNNWVNNGAAKASTQSLNGVYAARIGYGNGGISQNVTSKLVVGRSYSLSAKGRRTKNTAVGTIKIVFKNAADVIIQENKFELLYTSFQFYSVDFIVPVGTVKSEVVTAKSGTYLSYLYIDDFSLTDLNITPPPVVVTPPPVVVTPPPVTVPMSEFSPMGIGGGGAMSGVSISPYANLWIVGTDMGSIYRSTDLGQSWFPVNQFQAIFSSDLAKAASAGFSSDGTTVFHAVAGVNPKRSLNSGVSFSSISMGLLSGELIKYWSSDSSNASVMFAGTNKGLLKTADKGITWTRISSVAEEAIGTFIDQTSSTKRIYHAGKTKISVSDNGGASFNTYYTPSGISLRQFAGGADASGVTLAFGDNDGASACSWAYSFQNEWGASSVTNTVSNCGHTWVSTSGTNFMKLQQPTGDHLKMAENDASTIYTTGSRKWLKGYGTKVHVSHDKGQSFVLKLNQLDFDTIPYAPWPTTKIEYSAVALDVGWWDTGYESFAINQKNSNIVAGTGYFFLHSTLNAGENWQAPFTKYAGVGIPSTKDVWSSRGLEVTTVYKTKFHPSNSNLLYAAMADIGGAVSENHGKSFRLAGALYNSIYDYAFNASDDTIVYSAQGSQHDFPNEWQGNSYKGEGGIFKSFDKGRNWKRITPDDVNFNRQYLSVGYDLLHDRIYAGTQEAGVAVSYNGGTSWSYLNTGFPAGNKIIPQIEVDPATGNVYALLTGDAPTFSNQASTGIYFLDVQNGATIWKLLRGIVTPAAGATASQVWYYPTAFAIDFKSPNTIYLVDYENNGNWLMTGIWKTTNAGDKWTRVKQVTHPTEIKIDPMDSNKIYVASYYELQGQWGEGGQLASKDGGVTWNKNLIPSFQQNSRGVSIDPIDPSKIIYSYTGGGMLIGPNPNN